MSDSDLGEQSFWLVAWYAHLSSFLSISTVPRICMLASCVTYFTLPIKASLTLVYATSCQMDVQFSGVMQMLFAILAAVGVYLLVPRGISIGEVQLQSDHMSWNTTRGTYQLKLLAKIPIYNPNYMKVCRSALLCQARSRS